ncbi:hypothetical protein ACEWK1_02870 [Metabacillus sp. YM-086]|uniref:hypothetical protein n=1 Tax=Metabacillus sp. YM-086 TaxID=3341729 RepID=UPI003A8700DC
MRRVLVVLLGLLGCSMGIGLSLIALAMGEANSLSAAQDTGITSILYSGLATIGFIIIKFKPKLGGWLMIIGGFIIFGQFQNLGLIATVPLVVSGIIGMTIKQKQI